MFKFFRFMFLFCTLNYFSPAYADDAGSGAGSGSGTSGGAGGETLDQKLAAALKREEEYKAEIERMKKGDKKDPPKDDDDLIKKVAKDKETNEEIAKQTKEIERALGFNMRIDMFVKENKDLLPAEVSAIVAQANKETYDSAAAKAGAMKSAIIQSYFAVQANLDSITPAQKVALDDYLKLTKTGKEQRAADIYENIFEPALETVRRVKKAEEVSRSRSGFGVNTETNTAYKDRLVAISRRTHLGEKSA